MAEKTKLTPPDRKRCQAEQLGGSFMTLGPRPLIRCKNKPIVIVTENKPSEKDGQKGSMSLCLHCWKQMIKQCGKDYAAAEPI